ncbi:MFS transporter [Desulforamulus ruminis]|uniref:Major facilitator superfamily MFS_1 n=1 Tax=Desulforamulus ruminis (strain ATCC 23193 / DSM 2154 / NCIMB 8452 / DL) TaxID=696281 RepID=F6DL50_DESRL|nr:MFS transporter [Desulforamulus ruminis]AEG58359.1 major facilitator superfamily MFS_1 [Desulforamulus ruminis DSM 2154]
MLQQTNIGKLNKMLVMIMAVASGVTVANLYYIQPLLAKIASSFQVTQVSVGFAAMLTQAGYALGMLFLLPLADIREKRRLIITLLLCSACSLMLMFFSFNITLLALASFAVGFTSVVPQLIVPLAAQLADPKERGRIIGTVMSGLLIGILISRTFSGFVGEYWGWKMVYLMAALLMLALAALLSKALPYCPPISQIKYTELSKSMVHLTKTLPVLREASLNGAMMFAAFSAFWTSLVFLLEGPPYHLGTNAAGLFGLVGVVGALAAPVAGRIADKRSPRFTIGISMMIVILAYIIFWAFGYQLWGLVIGVILLDLGVQSCQISNQARVHALSDEARNRINTVFMVSYFVGGALGSLLGSYSYAHFQWAGVCIFGLLTQLMAISIHISYKKKSKPNFSQAN